jgi:signal peptidase I
LIRLHVTQRVLRAILVVVTLLGVLFMSRPPRVSATTGDTYVLPPSRYKVSSALFPLYHGKYSLVSVGKGSRIAYAGGFISTNNYHDLYGAFVFYGYDNQGLKTSWINILYDFRQMRNGEMAITLWGWGSPPLGTLYVKRTPRGDLVGRIRLLNGKSYPISFHKDSNRT